jgi:hypothetical protein
MAKRVIYGAGAAAAIIVFAYAFPAGLACLGDTTFDESQVRSALRATTFVLGWVAVLLYFVLLTWLIRAIWKHLGTEISTTILLISLAVIAVLFGNTITTVVRAPLYLAVRLMEIATTTYPETLSSFSGAQDISVFTDLLLSSVQQVSTAIVRELRDALLSLPVKDLLLALGFWALLYTAVIFQGGSAQTSGLQAWWQRLPAERRRDHVLMVLILTGAYLSIAAIISIPWLAGDDDAAVLTQEEVAKQLEGAVLTEKALSVLELDTLHLYGTLMGLRVYVDSLIKVADSTKLSGIKEGLVEARQAADQARADVSLLASKELPRYRSQVIDAHRKALTRALDSYQRETSLQMAPIERAVYLRDLGAWLGATGSELASGVTFIAGATDAVQEEIESWSRDQQEYLRATVDHELVRRSDSLAAYTGPGRPAYLRMIGVLRNQLTAPATYTLEPRPPDPGSSWGPFGWAARWLLRTRSIDLAQIAGMLGFGLFGAAIGVRGTSKPTPLDEQPGGDVGTVLVRGFAATLVVFLSVNGGLAIVGQGGTDPNSYVLFFACFLGAVYSEIVWRWAKEQLEGILKPKPQPPPPPPPPPAQPPPAQPPPAQPPPAQPPPAQPPPAQPPPAPPPPSPSVDNAAPKPAPAGA